MTTLDTLDWQTRAQAAERTAEVLKRRLRAIDAGEEKTLLQRRLESAQRRAAENDRRRALTELRNATLETEVAARTEQIRTILDHVGAGFLLLGPELTIAPGCSRSCGRLLGREGLTGSAFAEVMGWSGKRATEFALAAAQVFDDLLPEEASTAQLPSDAELRGRSLRVEYSVVRRGAEVASLLATITDVTAQVAAEREARRHQSLVQILMQREAFRMFVSDAWRQLAESSAALSEGDEPFARRAVHTVKGNAGSFGLDELVRTCHDVEHHPIDDEGLRRVREGLSGFLRAHRAVLGIDPEAEDLVVYTLAPNDLQHLINHAEHHDEAALQSMLSRLRARPANDFVGPLRASVSRLSERLAKDVRFEVVGGEIPLDPEPLRPVLGCLPHLLRNALDHGIEPSEERGEKPEQGRLTLSFARADDGITIEVRDDGRGIDPGRLAREARARGLLSDEEAARVREEDALRLLTTNGFSTAAEVTEISGRGVGLSAVQEAVAKVGGALSVHSVVGQGTRFTIAIPQRYAAAA